MKYLKLVFFTFILITNAISYAANNCCESLSAKQVESIIKKSHFNSEFQIAAKPEVVKEINVIRRTRYRRLAMQAAIQKIKQYHTILVAELKKHHSPEELLAIPMVETGYKASYGKGAWHPAGIWQMTPGTGRRFGLAINGKRDDRFNLKLSTSAALTYLNKMHEQFNNWMLAVLAFQYGEKKIHWLVKKVGTKNVWVLAHSSSAPKNFLRMITLFNADVIIMANPSLISSK